MRKTSLRNMLKRSVLCGSLVLGILLPTQALASTYENTETGYEALVLDEADLLSSSEEADLLEEMKAITEYGNVIFASTDYNTHSVEYYAEELYKDYFGRESGTLFVIDMDNRKISVYSDGEVYRTITDDYAQTITDNVYTYATDADYYQCASKAYEQITRLLEGKWIAQPMKYISNAFLAVAFALLINYFLVMCFSRSKKATVSQLVDGVYSKVDISNARANFTHQTKRYSPQSSSSSGGGGSSSSGGGGGGGGGGSHSF